MFDAKMLAKIERDRLFIRISYDLVDFIPGEALLKQETA